MRIAYLDVFAGISGDMTLGALVDAGVSLDAIRAELDKVPISGWEVEASKVSRCGIMGTQITVRLQDHDPERSHRRDHGRSCRELVELIEASDLDEAVVRKSTQILWRIAEAEAVVHGTTREQVHFHELGGLDSVVDIVGAVVGFRMLEVQQIICSPLPVSHGHVNCAHGRLPVPAPATAELMRGVPTFGLDVDGETVTPTGAAIATGLAAHVGGFPAMTVQTIGYGCGHADFPGVPNVLRLFVGERAGQMPGAEGGEGDWSALVADRLRLIEANLDDMNPEFFGRVVEQAFAAGAVDVWTSPISMKKGRPATQLSALAEPMRSEEVAAAILMESTTLGVRISDWERRCLPRQRLSVETPYGPVRVKLGMLGGRVVTASPEYEDCADLAAKHGVAVKEVYAAAVAAARGM